MKIVDQEYRNQYTVAAGKLDGGEVNWKYIEPFADLNGALKALKTCVGYPFIELTYVDDEGVTYDVAVTTKMENEDPLRGSTVVNVLQTNDTLVGLSPEYDPLGAQAALDASLVNAYIVRLRRLLSNYCHKDVSLGMDELTICRVADDEVCFQFKAEEPAVVLSEYIVIGGYRSLDPRFSNGVWSVTASDRALKSLDLMPNNAMFKRKA